jgi:hypothetical protein
MDDIWPYLVTWFIIGCVLAIFARRLWVFFGAIAAGLFVAKSQVSSELASTLWRTAVIISSIPTLFFLLDIVLTLKELIREVKRGDLPKLPE